MLNGNGKQTAVIRGAVGIVMERSIPLHDDFAESRAPKRIARGREISGIPNGADENAIDLGIAGLWHGVGAESFLMQHICNRFRFVPPRRRDLQELLAALGQKAFRRGWSGRFRLATP